MVFRYYHFMLEIWNGINLYSFAGDAWMVFIPRWRQMCRYAQPHTHTHQHTRIHTHSYSHTDSHSHVHIICRLWLRRRVTAWPRCCTERTLARFWACTSSVCMLLTSFTRPQTPLPQSSTCRCVLGKLRRVFVCCLSYLAFVLPRFVM